MSVKFNYDFGGSYEYPFEIDVDDAADYIKQTRDSYEIIGDFILSGLYEKESDDDKETLASYDGFDGTTESIYYMDEDTKETLADEVLVNIIKETQYYDDELRDYFEQEAYDAFEDQESDNADRRNNYGVNFS